ncbi:hypothetical protein [Myxococcus sp. Y35]|uniref:hypothetical protein n=1 Tax=Pseudomyxococcus flavus TaxID=3115648 RepID=UPI003CED62FC
MTIKGSKPVTTASAVGVARKPEAPARVPEHKPAPGAGHAAQSHFESTRRPGNRARLEGAAPFTPAAASPPPSQPAAAVVRPGVPVESSQAVTLTAAQAARFFDSAPGTTGKRRTPGESPSLQRLLSSDARARTVAEATPAAMRALDADSKAQAEEDFQRLMDAHYLARPYLTATLLEEHAGDPDYQAHLIGLLAESGPEGELQNVVAGFEGLFIISGAGEYQGSEAHREALLGALQAARDAGVINDADLQAFAQVAPGVWGEVLGALGVQVAQPPSGADAAVSEVEQATSEYEAAQEEARKRDEWLAQQLADMGDLLTEEQKQAYINAYRNDPENKAVYDDLEAKAARLAEVVQANASVMEAAAYADPQGDGAALRKALELLADSSHAAVALEMGARYLADPTSPMGQVVAHWGDFETKVLEKGIANATAQLLADEDPETAFARLQELLEPLQNAKGPAATAYRDLKDGLEAIQQARAGNYDRLTQLAQRWDSASPLMRGLAVAGVAFGAVSAIAAGREGDFAGMLQGLASAGERGAQLTAGVLQSMSIVGEASRAASFAAKLAPALGLVANATALGIHLNQFAQEQNPGYLIAAFGDAVGVLGSVLELTPAAPVGFVVSGIGAAISAIGELTVAPFEAAKLNDARKRYLEAIGVSPELSQVLRDADPERIEELRHELGISAEDVQALAVQMPSLLTEGTNNGLYFDPVVEMFKAYGIHGDDAYALLSTMGNGNEDPSNSTLVVLLNISREAGFAQTPEDFDRLLQRLRAQLPEHASTIDAILAARDAQA